MYECSSKTPTTWALLPLDSISYPSISRRVQLHSHYPPSITIKTVNTSINKPAYSIGYVPSSRYHCELHPASESEIFWEKPRAEISFDRDGDEPRVLSSLIIYWSTTSVPSDKSAITERFIINWSAFYQEIRRIFSWKADNWIRTDCVSSGDHAKAICEIRASAWSVIVKLYNLWRKLSICDKEPNR